MKNYVKDMRTKKFWIYFGRWQFSAIVMMPFMIGLEMLGLPLWLNLSLGQAIGALIFWKIDLLIFKNHKSDNIEDAINNNIISVSDRKL